MEQYKSNITELITQIELYTATINETLAKLVWALKNLKEICA